MIPGYPTPPPSGAATTMDPVADLLGGGRVVAFQVAFGHAFGSANAGLWLSQLWFWANSDFRGPRRDGEWIAWTQDEVTAQTALTRREADTARRILRDKGILHEERRGLPARVWYRLDKDRLYTVLRDYAASAIPSADQFGGMRQTGSDTADASSDEESDAPNNFGENRQTVVAVCAELSREDAPDQVGVFRQPIYRDAGAEIRDEIIDRSDSRSAEITVVADAETREEIAAAVVDPSIDQSPNPDAEDAEDAEDVRAAVASIADAEAPAPPPDPLLQALLDADLARDTALRLLAPREDGKDARMVVQRQIDWLPLRDARDNAAGLLRRAIEQDWSAPPAVAEEARRRAERERQREAATTRAAEAEERRRREDEANRQREAAWASLTVTEREAVEEAAWQRAVATNVGPLRAQVERAAKSQTAPPEPVAAALRVARTAVLDQIAAGSTPPGGWRDGMGRAYATLAERDAAQRLLDFA